MTLGYEKKRFYLLLSRADKVFDDPLRKKILMELMKKMSQSIESLHIVLTALKPQLSETKQKYHYKRPISKLDMINSAFEESKDDSLKLGIDLIPAE